jgi:ribosomal protein S18 acetylase RimI-like enzyme
VTGASQPEKPPVSFSIRRCRGGDAIALANLGARLFAETYGPTHPEPELSRYLAREFSVAKIGEAIADEGVTMLLAEGTDGVAIGYAFVRPSMDPPDGVNGNRALEIARFYVDGRVQGRGVGAALMRECLDVARRQDADVVWLQVWKEAPWAVGFYRKMGFTVVGSAPFYFGEQIGDDHIMAIAL